MLKRQENFLIISIIKSTRSRMLNLMLIFVTYVKELR